MGRGDKKTKRGKIFKGSHGKLRPSKKVNKPKTATVHVVKEEPVIEVAEAPKKRAVAKKSKPAGE